MKKERRKELAIAIKNNTVNYNDILDITKSLYKTSFWRFLIFSIILIVSIIYADKISKLAIITADTVLNHEVYFSPTIYYFTSIGVLVGLEALMGLFIFYKNRTIVKEEFKLYIKTFKVYDILVFVLEILVTINFIIMFLLTPVTIEGSSMNNTYQSGDKVMIWHFMYTPNNDDVVVLDANPYIYSNEGDNSLNEKNQRFFIKRIAAKENDVLTISQNFNNHDYYYLFCNSKPLECNINAEQWKKITGLGVEKTSYVIPENKLLLLGDNRPHSTDGRVFGLVNEKDILGKVLFRYYPFNKIGNPDKNIVRPNR